MMASVNKATLIGHIGQDPETRFMPDGTQVCRLNLATTEAWKDKSGEKQQRIEWHRLVLYRKLAEIAAQYLKKGSLLYVEGRIRTQKWTDKSNIERYTTEILVDTLQMLDRKTDTNKSTGSESPPDFGQDDDISY